MSTLTLAPPMGAVAEPSSKPGILTRLIERGSAEQTRRARLVVYRYLAGHTDAKLAELGFSQSEIADIRAAGKNSTVIWG
ncbi:MAG: hypothetical protein KGP27_16260 [Hyphomicrobiales bacterium]|nr:hypothetical protein [Hyphomicrobiales bacterium]